MKKRDFVALKIIIAITSLIIAFIIIWAAINFINWSKENTNLLSSGVEQTSTPIKLTGILAKATEIILGLTTSQLTGESLILHLIIFVLFFSVISHAFNLNSLSKTLSVIISLAVTCLIGITGGIHSSAEILGLTAGIGALGIIFLILMAIISALIVNLGFGGVISRLRHYIEIEQQQARSEKGFQNAIDVLTTPRRPAH